MYISNDERKLRTEGSLEVQVRCVLAFPEKQGLSRFDNRQFKDLLEANRGGLCVSRRSFPVNVITGLRLWDSVSVQRESAPIGPRVEMKEGDRASELFRS